jgi:phosphatidylethanolamine-binding protein (PEBP) family uncharacterized protein
MIPRRTLQVLTITALLLVGTVSRAHEGHAHGTGDPSARVWTMAGTGSQIHSARIHGAQIHGSYVASRDGKVQVRRADGTIVSLAIVDLSLADKQWIERKLKQLQQIHETAIPAVRIPSFFVAHAPAKPAIADTFEPFAKLKAVKYRQDDKFFYVESNSMPDHRMMVGITAWQQQVPIPQPYFGDNAWRIPLEPVVAKNPMSAKSHFFRGAIALAANGVPIFNPIKNDGRTDTFLAGELDEFGGHCGRADDYHYHIAPTHLQAIVGNGKPIAYALDGYPIYGFTEPDGSAVQGLDEFNGHSSPELGYHYHATKKYPYLNGGFHGEVKEIGGQVDPQPRTGGVREALPPWRGAKITGFDSKDNKSFSVKVQVGKETHYVNYVLNDNGSVTFHFVDSDGKTEVETYTPRRQGRGGAGGPGNAAGGNERGRAREGEGNGRPAPRSRTDESKPAAPPLLIQPKKSGNLRLTSPAFSEGEPLPNEFNGNGEGATPPLVWKGVPEGTKSFAIVMDHIDRDQQLKTYWNLYGIPANVTSLSKNVQGVGTTGATWKRDQAYVPPHSAGGAKQTYTIHLYALSILPRFDGKEGGVTREELLSAVKDHILDSADLSVTYQRPAGESNSGPRRPGSQDSKGRGRNGKAGQDR